MAELQSPLGLVDLPNGARIVVEAIDPATGAQVTGVLVSNLAITYTLGGSGAPFAPSKGDPVLVRALSGKPL